jgi:DNA-binding NarL/FixJ family response regulator
MDQDILVIHQHRLMLDMLEHGLQKQLPELTVATQLFIDTAQTTQKLKIILIEIEQLNKVAFKNLEPLIKQYPGARIVVLGSHPLPEALLARGVHTIMDLNQSLDDTMQRVSEIISGRGRGRGIMVSKDPANPPCSVFSRLSEREREVLRALCSGQKSVTIATKMDISPQTVHSYISRICTKLEVDTRQESVFLGMRHYEELQAL